MCSVLPSAGFSRTGWNRAVKHFGAEPAGEPAAGLQVPVALAGGKPGREVHVRIIRLTRMWPRHPRVPLRRTGRANMPNGSAVWPAEHLARHDLEPPAHFLLAVPAVGAAYPHLLAYGQPDHGRQAPAFVAFEAQLRIAPDHRARHAEEASVPADILGSDGPLVDVRV